MTTYIPKGADLERKWFLIDAQGQVLGKLATLAATILTGKRKPTYTPFLDTGDHVIVINASQIHLTGRKETGKVYHRHTGYPGGLKSVRARELATKAPERMIEEAVRGMLPKSRLGRKQLKKLKVYRGPAHPHEAQKPRVLAMPARRAARPAEGRP